MKTLRYFYASLLFLPSFVFAIDLQANVNPDSRVLFSGSIKQVSSGAVANGPRIKRSVLKSDELKAPMKVVVGLEMRNPIEFHTRIDGGSKISSSEMESRFLPLQSDYDKVAGWLKTEGFTLDDPVDPKRLNIFAHHSVAAVGRVFQLKFARVETSEGEFTSAVTAPSVPRGTRRQFSGYWASSPISSSASTIPSRGRPDPFSRRRICASPTMCPQPSPARARLSRSSCRVLVPSPLI